MARKRYALHGLHPELSKASNPIWEGNSRKRKICLSGEGVEARYDEGMGTEK